MTMPHLMNCPHCEDWCLDCVKKMHDEMERQIVALRKLVDEQGVLLAAVKSSAYSGISCDDVAGWNWFDRRDACVAS